MTIIFYSAEAHRRNESVKVREIKTRVFDADKPGKAYILYRGERVWVNPSVRRDNVWFTYENMDGVLTRTGSV